MSKRYDATPKALVELRPGDWPPFLGVQATQVEVVDADVSTVTRAADKVLRVRTRAGTRIQHFDFQAGPDASVPGRTHTYNAVLEERHQLPVDSVVFLLRRQAHLKVINGLYEKHLPGEREPYRRFRYRVVRVWELPVEEVLQAGLAVLPLAPISKVRQNELPAVIERMQQRLDREADPGIVGELWTATTVLLGLRYQAGFIQRLLQGVRNMKESTTYQAILEEGRTEEARRMLLRVGEDRFGAKPARNQMLAIQALTDPAHLEDLVVRVNHVGNWEELLAPTSPPPAPPRSRRKKSS
jgi:predicted transposase YdaD